MKKLSLLQVFHISVALFFFLPLATIIIKVASGVGATYILLDVTFLVECFLLVGIGKLLTMKRRHLFYNVLSFLIILLAIIWGFSALGGIAKNFSNLIQQPELFEAFSIEATLLYIVLLSIALIQIACCFIYYGLKKNNFEIAHHNVDINKRLYLFLTTAIFLIVFIMTGIYLILKSDDFYIRFNLVFISSCVIIYVCFFVLFRVLYIKNTANAAVFALFFLPFAGGVAGISCLFLEAAFLLFKLPYLLIALLSVFTFIFGATDKGKKGRK